ncbi:FAD-dependent oxidoreductase [Ochrobactrum sp. Kaboul]|nr:FAD-dependent oxidoreductase [Ochrobactrum sp. Kaboul]
MATYNSEVFIYGATFPGLVAARKIAAMGHTVNVCEWTTHVGGLTTGGLGKGDIVGQPGTANNTRWGLVLDFFKTISANPPYNNTDGSEVYNFANSEGIAAMNQILLDDSKVVVATGCWLKAVTKDPISRKITSVTMQNGDVYTASIFLDCSYEGDLAAMSGVTMSYGRDSQRHYNERVQDREGYGVQRPGINIEGADEEDFKSVDENGNLYPWRTWPPSPWLKDGDPSSRAQAFGFRHNFSRREDRLPWPMPAGYRREDFLWVADMIANNGGAGSTFPLRISGYEVSGAGSNKFVTNGGDLPGFFTNQWTKASYQERIRIQNAAFYFCAGVMYFAANDTAVSSTYRNRLNLWGLCADEFQDDYIGAPGWASAYYVRQSRTMVGQYVMTTADMFDDGTGTNNWHKADSIAVGGYTIDAHPHYWWPDPDGERTWEEGKLEYNGLKLYSIPLRSILPVVSQVSNLIVPVAFSASTLNLNSARMEPTWGVMCESAGTLAALALDQGKDINDVPYDDLRTALDAAGAVLTR